MEGKIHSDKYLYTPVLHIPFIHVVDYELGEVLSNHGVPSVVMQSSFGL